MVFFYKVSVFEFCLPIVGQDII